MDKHSSNTDGDKLTELKPTAKIARKCEQTNTAQTTPTQTQAKLTEAWEARSRSRPRHDRPQAQEQGAGKQVHRQQADRHTKGAYQVSLAHLRGSPISVFQGRGFGYHVTGFHFVPLASSITVVFGESSNPFLQRTLYKGIVSLFPRGCFPFS